MNFYSRDVLFHPADRKSSHKPTRFYYFSLENSEISNLFDVVIVVAGFCSPIYDFVTLFILQKWVQKSVIVNNVSNFEPPLAMI